MIHSGRRLLAFSLATLALPVFSVFVASPASAAAVDLSFALKAGEDTSCRQWQPNQTVSWNFTLAMNGTDSSSITTPTYVWINDSGAPAMQDDGWTPVLAASGDAFSNPPSYDSANSNDFVVGTDVYAPSSNGLDIYLYSAAHGAPATNLTLLVTGSPDSENKDHYLNISARTHRQGAPDVTRTVSLCVHIPPNPRYEMGARDASIRAAADSTISVNFWLKNTGNTQDYYFCSVAVPNQNWTGSFAAGVIIVGPNVTGLLNISQNLSIRILVTIPPGARALENSTVALNCTSFKAAALGLNLFVSPPYTRVEVIQYFLVAGRIPTGSPSTLGGLPGDTLRFDFVVQNLGNGPDQGRARLQSGTFAGSDSWATSINTTDFVLADYGDPGFEQAAQFVVTIPPGTPIGTYTFRVNITSTTNGTPVTTLTFRIQVLQVYLPLMSPVPPQVGAPGDEFVFNFTIMNGGNGLDSLVIQITNLSGWRVFLSPPFGKKLLESGAAFAFQATVIAPAVVQAGRYDQRVRISSEYAQLDLGALIFAETNLTVIIPADHACEFRPAYRLLEASPPEFPGSLVDVQASVGLSNLGQGAETFTLSALAPAALDATITPQHPSMTFEANVSVYLRIRTSASPLPGSYTVAATARADANPSAFCTATFELRIVYPPGPPLPSSLNLTINGVRTSEVEADTPSLFEIDLENGSSYWMAWWFDGAATGTPSSPTVSLGLGSHTITVRVSNGTDSRDFAFTVLAVAPPTAPPPPSPALPPHVNLTVNGSTNSPPVLAGAPISVSLDLSNTTGYNVSWYLDEAPAGTGPEISLTLSAGTHNVTAVVSNATDSESYSFDIVAREVPTTAPEGASFLPVALLLAAAGGAAAFALLRRRRV